MALINKQDNLFINDSRFLRGMKLFNSCQWYESHDVFEEIWHETSGSERQFLQAIVQVAVAQVHLENGNRNGATILYGEALGRLKKSKLVDSGLDVEKLCECITKRLESLQIGQDLSSCGDPLLNFIS